MTNPLRALSPRAVRALLLALTLALVAVPVGPRRAARPSRRDGDARPGVGLDHDVTSDLLSAPSIAQGSALSEQANVARAVAGVNGDFFDINNSNAALGFEIQGGELRKSGDRNGGQSFGVTRDGISQLVNLQAPEGGMLPAGTTALVGRDAGADALRTLAVGDAVTLSYALSPEAASRLSFAVGTDVVLVRDGVQRPDGETSQGAAGTSRAAWANRLRPSTTSRRTASSAPTRTESAYSWRPATAAPRT